MTIMYLYTKCGHGLDSEFSIYRYCIILNDCPLPLTPLHHNTRLVYYLGVTQLLQQILISNEDKNCIKAVMRQASSDAYIDLKYMIKILIIHIPYRNKLHIT
jgi:hypothetical protein